ncbi:MAG: YdeI/OmpD-associated family protein [Bacteroidia bacterium]|nr:YdeI/OmpD-associated family protein [Bacteroidia bacterium]
MTLTFFAQQNEFRTWLAQNHKTATEFAVGFYKLSSGKSSMTWSQSVDEALCYGWIDGMRKAVNNDSYEIRFTPRKATSIWSAVNIEKMEVLIQQGLMQPAGIASFEKRTESRSKIYTYETDAMQLSVEFENEFKANKSAWNYFITLAPSYKKTSINWVMSAKHETTQLKRLLELIANSQASTNKWKDNKYNKKLTF